VQSTEEEQTDPTETIRARISKMMQELELLENKCKTLSASSFPDIEGSHSLTTGLESIGRELTPQGAQVLQGGEILAVQAAHHVARLEVAEEEAVVGEEASVQEWQFSAPAPVSVPTPVSQSPSPISPSPSPSKSLSVSVTYAAAAAATPPAATTVSPTVSKSFSTPLTPSFAASAAAAAAAAAAATEDELKAKMKLIGRRNLIEEDGSSS